MNDIVIVGAGHAAVRAALSIRDAGFAGRLTMIAEEGGEIPYERPLLSKWGIESEVSIKPIVPADQLTACDVNRVNGRVENVDPDLQKLVLSDGTRVEYAKLLLATGATARRLPEALTGEAKVHYLRDADDAMIIHSAASKAKSAIIIGGGFIGLELAASLRQQGLNVHVLEVADRLLERAVSKPVADVVQHLHTKAGVEFTFGAQIAKVTDAGAVLESGAEIQADIIIAGVGSSPMTTLAQDAGVSVSDGIVVDAQMRTSNAKIFAAGDCVSFPLYGDLGPLTRLESWRAAGDQGALAGRNMISDTLEEFTATPWFWSEQYDHVLQVTGLPASDQTLSVRQYDDTHCISFGQDSTGHLSYACGIAPSVKIAKDIRFASKIIESGMSVSQDALNDKTVTLKSLILRK